MLEDADWALELREAAGKAGKGSVDFDRMVADVLLRVGRLEEARAVLKVKEAKGANQASRRIKKQ